MNAKGAKHRGVFQRRLRQQSLKLLFGHRAQVFDPFDNVEERVRLPRIGERNRDTMATKATVRRTRAIGFEPTVFGIAEDSRPIHHPLPADGCGDAIAQIKALSYVVGIDVSHSNSVSATPTVVFNIALSQFWKSTVRCCFGRYISIAFFGCEIEHRFPTFFPMSSRSHITPRRRWSGFDAFSEDVFSPRVGFRFVTGFVKKQLRNRQSNHLCDSLPCRLS